MATMPDSTQHMVRLTQALFSSNMIYLSQICIELETKQKRKNQTKTIHSPGSNSSFNSLKLFLIPPTTPPLAHGFLGCSSTPVPPGCPILSLSRGSSQPASLLPACPCPACSRPQVVLRTLPLPFALPGVSDLWLLPMLRHQVLAWIFSIAPAMGTLRASGSLFQSCPNSQHLSEEGVHQEWHGYLRVKS